MTTVAADRPSRVVVAPTVRTGLSSLELFAALVALVLPVGFATGLAAPGWSIRAAILLVVAAVGLPVLFSQTRGPRPWAARAAVGFLAAGTASAVLSENHTTAIFGLYSQGTGLLFMVSLAAAWAIGRSLRPEARPLLERALLLGILVDIAIAVLSSVVNLTSISPYLIDANGRAAGLTDNPVNLAALALLGLALIVPRFVIAPRAWAVPVAAAAAAIQLSGTRGALVVMMAIALWAGRRHGLRVAAGLAVLLVIGLAAATAMGTSSHVSAVARSGDLADWRTRPETWLSVRHSIAERPLLGVGPGQFRSASSPYRPVTVGRSEGPDRLFTDAHNIFVEYLTTTGVLGLAALLVWLLADIGSARGWLLVGALAVFAIHLFEPQSVVTTPLAFLALGASGSIGTARSARRPRSGRWLAPLCLTGAALAAGSALLLGQFQMNQAQLDLRLGPAQSADAILPSWSATASLKAQALLFHAITNGHNQAEYRRSRDWRLAAVQRDDTDPGLWNDLAELDESLGQYGQAEAEYRSAVRLNPTSVRAMDGLARLARDRCDAAQEQYWHMRSLQVLPQPAPSAALGRGALQHPGAICATGP